MCFFEMSRVHRHTQLRRGWGGDARPPPRRGEDARVEVAEAAAADQACEMLAKQVADAYKEGMAAARTFLKDMRSLS